MVYYLDIAFDNLKYTEDGLICDLTDAKFSVSLYVRDIKVESEYELTDKGKTYVVRELSATHWVTFDDKHGRPTYEHTMGFVMMKLK